MDVKPRVSFDPRTGMWTCAIQMDPKLALQRMIAGLPHRDPYSWRAVSAEAAYRGWKRYRDAANNGEQPKRAVGASAGRWQQHDFDGFAPAPVAWTC